MFRVTIKQVKLDLIIVSQFDELAAQLKYYINKPLKI